jgi:hypothetical protein
MGLETDERPSFPEATSSYFGTGRTTTPASWSLLQIQPEKRLGKINLPFTSPATRTLSTMWPEWTLEDDCPSLSLQGRSVSHSHSQQSEGLTELLGLAAEDWCGPGTSAPFKITSLGGARVKVQVAGGPQSPTWCYLTFQVSFILHRSPWWGGWSPPPAKKRKAILLKFKILIKVNFKMQITK